MSPNEGLERWELFDTSAYSFAANQRPQSDEVQQRVCPHCKGKSFQVFKGKRPEKGILGYFTECTGCGSVLWMRADLTR